MAIFGLQWTQATYEYVRPDTGNATPNDNKLTHLAVTSPTNASTLAAVAQASTHAPWSGMRRCNLWNDGTPTAYYGDRCYTDTDVANMGQVMVQIPKFWYTTDHGDGVYIWYISDTGEAGTEPAGHDHDWAVHPAFKRLGGTVERDYIYLGAYEAYLNGTKLESVSGFQPTASQTLPQFRTAARLRVPGSNGTITYANKWEPQDYLTTTAVQLLNLVEYGSFRSQTLLSVGITNMADGAANMSCNTGHTTTLGNASGEVSFTAEQQAVTVKAMSYRGIENFYGNQDAFIDGINIKQDLMPWVADHDFACDSFTHPYVDTTVTCDAVAGYISDISPTVDYAFFPVAHAGAAGTYLGDYYQPITGGNKIVQVGERWNAGTQAGMFSYRGYYTSAHSLRYIGARLEYIG